MDTDYMKLVRQSLSLFGCWPYKEFGIKKHIILICRAEFIFCVDIITISSGILYLKNRVNVISFFELGHTYITVMMNIIGIQRVISAWTKGYKTMTTEFVLRYHLIHHKDKSAYSLEIYELVHKTCSFFSKFIRLQMYIGYFLFTLIPMYNNLQTGMYSFNNRPENGTFDLSVYYELPFDYTTKVPGYVGVFIFNIYLSYLASNVFCFIDLFTCIIVFHIWGHLKILKYNLKNFPRPEHDKFRDEDAPMIKEHIVDLMSQHKLIVEFTNVTSSGFGHTLAFYFLFHQVAGCILLLECSQLNTEALAKYGPLTIILLQQLLQVTIVFDLLTKESSSLKDCVYDLPWESMDNKNRKIMFFFMQNVQDPIELKAAGIVPVSLQTGIQIIKTSLSYFLMLRTFTSHE